MLLSDYVVISKDRSVICAYWLIKDNSSCTIGLKVVVIIGIIGRSKLKTQRSHIPDDYKYLSNSGQGIGHYIFLAFNMSDIQIVLLQGQAPPD